MSHKFQNEFLVPKLLIFIYEWEDYVELEIEDEETKIFHLSLIRSVKGLLKAWRRRLGQHDPDGG